VIFYAKCIQLRDYYNSYIADKTDIYFQSALGSPFARYKTQIKIVGNQIWFGIQANVERFKCHSKIIAEKYSQPQLLELYSRYCGTEKLRSLRWVMFRF